MADTVRTQALIRIITTAIQAKKNCAESGNTEWAGRWASVIDNAQGEFPRGGGFDSSAEIDFDRTKPNKLVICGAYHPMDNNGYYRAWVNFTITCTPSFDGFDIACRGAGSEYNDYIAESYHDALRGKYDPAWFRDDLK